MNRPLVLGLFRTAVLLFLSTRSIARYCPQDRDDSNSSTRPGAPVVVHLAEDVFPRYDILHIVYKKQLSKQLDLLIQAFLRIQDRPISSPVSYFQIASIHGQPYQAWDGVKTQDPKLANLTEPINNMTAGKLSEFAGYCWHASVLFPTWHRAYSLLFEQELRNEAMEIAHEYGKEVRREYIEAAYQLRLPFWDWVGESACNSGVPEFLLLQEVEINTPIGREKVRNPFESYVFPADIFKGIWGHERGMKVPEGVVVRTGLSPSLKGDGICRHPNQEQINDYNNMQEDLITELSGYIKPAVDTLLSDPEIAKSYAKYATHKPTHSAARPRSTLKDMEGIHDTVHDVIGGIVFAGEQGFPGHMSDVNVAAYDPIFYLVHSNLDRITAKYQLMNPDSWIEHTEEPHVRNYMAGHDGMDVNSSTPLWPFRKSPTEFYSSDDLRNISKLGYTYPEFMPEGFSIENFTLGSYGSHRPQALYYDDCEVEILSNTTTNGTDSNSKSSFEQMAHLFRQTHKAIFKKTHVFENGKWCPHSSLPWCRTKL